MPAVATVAVLGFMHAAGAGLRNARAPARARRFVADRGCLRHTGSEAGFEPHHLRFVDHPCDVAPRLQPRDVVRQRRGILVGSGPDELSAPAQTDVSVEETREAVPGVERAPIQPPYARGRIGGCRAKQKIRDSRHSFATAIYARSTFGRQLRRDGRRQAGSPRGVRCGVDDLPRQPAVGAVRAPVRGRPGTRRAGLLHGAAGAVPAAGAEPARRHPWRPRAGGGRRHAVGRQRRGGAALRSRVAPARHDQPSVVRQRARHRRTRRPPVGSARPPTMRWRCSIQPAV